MRSRSSMVALLVAACGRQAAPSAPAPSAPPEVVVTPVVSRQFQGEERVPAEIFGFYWVSIFPRVPAFVQDVLVDRSYLVKKGQLLARLSAPELTADRAQAQATAIGDRETLQRLRQAAETPGAIAKNELDLASAKVGADDERVQALRTLEGYLKVIAPFDGVVTERNIHPGALVGPGSSALPLFRIDEIDRLRVTANVPEADVGAIAEGAPAKFSVVAWPGELFQGVIRRPAFALDQRTRTMPVEIDFSNAARRIEPGMYAEVLWPVRREIPSLFVPASAIVRTTESLFVEKVDRGVVSHVPVQQGKSEGEFVEVFGALHAGDLVIQKGNEELQNDAHVTPKIEGPKTAAND